MYQPKPIDTGDIRLTEDLGSLCEKLARNVHEVWAQGRIREGWIYGEHRDDATKQTPCLVPYRPTDTKARLPHCTERRK